MNKKTLLKLSAMAICVLLTKISFASGCRPGDEQLVSEKAIYKVGDFNANLYCVKGSSCQIVVSKPIGVDYELHYLLRQSDQPYAEESMQKDIGILESFIYRQAWSGSCDETYRYVFGVDYRGERYRDQIDLGQIL